MKKQIFIWLILASVIIIAVFSIQKSFSPTKVTVGDESSIRSFIDCANAGLPITESSPRQCATKDGRTYAEEITPEILYTNASSGMITLTLPYPGAVTGKEFLITGKALGTWFFEASFPIEIIDSEGKTLLTTIAKAQGDWMTTDFVPFIATATIKSGYEGEATVILRKDNPSGLPEKDASIAFPITIEY